MKKIAHFLAFLSAGLSALHFLRIRSAQEIGLAFPKLMAGAISPFVAALGFTGAVLGLLARVPLASVAGLFGLWSSVRYMKGVVSAAADFAPAFGQYWSERIPLTRQFHMLKERWTWNLPTAPEPCLEKDIPFWTIPDTERQLLCDIWQPADDIPRSGLALIYLHGSGWHYLDKDMGTRPLFRHLTAQGHVIMDVAYRLCPETDWRGMQADAKRAIAWMKANAQRYGIKPEQIVIAGGSAGGHLALLAAYTAQTDDLRPTDVANADLTVCGVVSWYGPTDMNIYYNYAGNVFSTVVGQSDQKSADESNQWLAEKLGVDTSVMNAWEPGVTVQDNMMRALFGGTPTEVPDEYRLGSPITHVSPNSPPTLLLQGADDFIVSAATVRTLAEALGQTHVPVVHVEYPQTDHAFDLILPRFSPSAQASLYETERFLALLVAR